MPKIRRMLLLTLTFMVFASIMLSGCGSKQEDTSAKSDSTASKTEGTASEEAKGDPVELIWYTVGTPQKDVDLVMEELSKYTKEKINATIKMKMFDWGDYTQKMQVLAASGEPYDIAFTCSWAFDYVPNQAKGYFLELDDLIEKYGQGIKSVLHPAFLEGSKIDGHNYAIPVNKELGAQKVYRFNKKYLDKYKLDISNVKTLEDLEPLLKVVKEGEGKKFFPISTNKDFRTMIPFDLVNEGIPVGVSLNTTDYKLVNTFETPEMMKLFETLRKYYQAGYIATDAPTIGDNSSIMKTGDWFVDIPNTAPFADIGWTNSLGYPVVSVPAEESYVYNWSVTGSMMAINKNSEHPEEAMKFLNLLNTDPYVRNLVDKGIEGRHYQKVEGKDNVIQYLPLRKEAYDMPSFTLGNMFLTYLLPEDPSNKWDEFDKFNKAAKNAPLLGFNFDVSKVKTELAACINVQKEFYPSLYNGAVDPQSYIPKALKKFKEAGLDKVIEEAQRQLDEWKAAQGK